MITLFIVNTSDVSSKVYYIKEKYSACVSIQHQLTSFSVQSN